jgi:hypothetical protein
VRCERRGWLSVCRRSEQRVLPRMPLVQLNPHRLTIKVTPFD